MSWLSWACLWESILSTLIDIEDLAYEREHYALGLNPGLEKRRRAESKQKKASTFSARDKLLEFPLP